MRGFYRWMHPNTPLLTATCKNCRVTLAGMLCALGITLGRCIHSSNSINDAY